jgi:hypothetical protein
MRVGRLFRIAVIACLLPLAFRFSQRVAAANGNPPVEGIQWALGALSLLFLLRAMATEYARGPEADFQKDLQWGIAAGGLLAILTRL